MGYKGSRVQISASRPTSSIVLKSAVSAYTPSDLTFLVGTSVLCVLGFAPDHKNPHYGDIFVQCQFEI